MKIPLRDSYRVTCLVFAVIISGILIYSLVFGYERQHPVPSGSVILYGEDSISTGLSRSFSAIVRFEFAEAKAWNPYGMRIFLFFFIQLLMRVGGYILAGRVREHRSLLIYTDIILSIALFFIAFWPFIIAVIGSRRSL